MSSSITPFLPPPPFQSVDKIEKEVTRWLLERKSANTSSTYSSYTRDFQQWCERQGLTAFPAAPAAVARYLIHLEERGLKASTVNVASAAISSQYQFSHLPSPTLDPLVKATRKTIAEVAPPPSQKLPLTVEMVKAIAKRHEHDSSFVGTRNTCLIILMMAAFLRESEATALLRDDVWLDAIPSQDHSASSSSTSSATVPALLFFVEKTKTVRDRRGHTIIVPASTDPLICPHEWFKKYRARRSASATHFFHKDNGNEALAAATPNHIVKTELEQIGVDATRYGSHSCRSGGVSEASDRGCAVEIIKRHGHWTSDAVFNYIRDSWERKMKAKVF